MVNRGAALTPKPILGSFLKGGCGGKLLFTKVSLRILFSFPLLSSPLSSLFLPSFLSSLAFDDSFGEDEDEGEDHIQFEPAGYGAIEEHGD